MIQWQWLFAEVQIVAVNRLKKTWLEPISEHLIALFTFNVGGPQRIACFAHEALFIYNLKAIVSRLTLTG